MGSASCSGDPARTPAAERAAADLHKAAQGFEELFLGMMLKSARSASLGDDIMGGEAVDSARDMLDTELSRTAAGHANLGIAAAVERQFAPMIGKKA